MCDEEWDQMLIAIIEICEAMSLNLYNLCLENALNDRHGATETVEQSVIINSRCNLNGIKASTVERFVFEDAVYAAPITSFYKEPGCSVG